MLFLCSGEILKLSDFLPFSFIAKGVAKVRHNQTRSTLLRAPLSKNQPWYPQLLKLIVASSLPLRKKSEPLIYSQNRNDYPKRNCNWLDATYWSYYWMILCLHHCNFFKKRLKCYTLVMVNIQKSNVKTISRKLLPTLLWRIN